MTGSRRPSERDSGGGSPRGRIDRAGPERGVPEGDSAQKRRIRSMFDAVAPRYDTLNHLLSAGIDHRWRKHAIAGLELAPGHRLLDLCTGTGDLGLEALRAVPGIEVIGVDLARAMLARGERKRRRMGNGAPAPPAMLFTQGDAECLPLADASVDRACVGFGIRNVSSLARAFAETARVLIPGGRFAVLEFTTPPNALVRAFYHAYFHHLLPRVGGWVSGQGEAYRYLPDSVSRFPSPKALAELARSCGFASAEYRLLHGGIAALHLCRR